MAAAISSFGSAMTAVATPVLVVQLLGATAFEVGVVSAAQFVPYALLGLVAGVYIDRWRRDWSWPMRASIKQTPPHQLSGQRSAAGWSGCCEPLRRLPSMHFCFLANL